jgi:hypothetical protein
MGKLFSKSNFRWFGPLNGSYWALKVIRCRPSWGYKRWKLSVAIKVTLKVIRWISGNKISVESYQLPKKSIENEHGKIHPWTTVTDRNRKKYTTGIQTDRNGGTSGPGQQLDRRTGRGAGTQTDRNRDTDGQGQQLDRRTGRGAGTQTDRNRDTDGQGHSQTRTGTQMDRGRDTEGQGKGHKRTRTGIWTQTFTTLTDNLQKNKRVESVKF